MFCLDKPAFIKEVYAVDDIETLRQIIIRKERERQSIANDLEVAARIGLVISETNEAIQLKVPLQRLPWQQRLTLSVARTFREREQDVSRRT